MDFSAGEIPDEPGFHSAEQQVARREHFPRLLAVVQDPANFCCGKIRVDDQTGMRGDIAAEFLVFLQLFTHFGGTAALPDDRVINRLAGRFIPQDRRLALVRHADADDVFCLDPTFDQGIHKRPHLA